MRRLPRNSQQSFKLTPIALAFLAADLIMVSPSLLADIAPDVLPEGGMVAAGQASIQSSGSQMTIHQSTDKAILNWDRFNIGADAHVHIQQPSSSSATLNRVITADPSHIYGQLSANGQVFLINPNGILFGQGARIDVGGLVASTLNIADKDFMSGHYRFNGGGEGRISNNGSLMGGFVSLVAPEIENEGSILARVGNVMLASGDAAVLTFADNNLISIKVDEATLKSSIRNTGSIVAENGLVLLKASAAQSLIDETINAPESAQLVSINGVPLLINVGGEIIAKEIEIDAGDNGGVQVSGTMNVSNPSGLAGKIQVRGKEVRVTENAELSSLGNAGEVEIDAGDNGGVLVSGTLTVSNPSGAAGKIQVLGKEVRVTETAELLSRGATGGGEILVGGDWGGGNEVRQAIFTTVERGAYLDASATQLGDGGTIVTWSNIGDARSVTEAHGTFFARGGEDGGGGGRIETSGHLLRTREITIDTSAPKGGSGHWLLDPTSINIKNGDGSSSLTTSSGVIGTTATDVYEVDLESVIGSNILLQSTTGNITLEDLSDGELTLSSNVSFSATTTGGNIIFNDDTNTIKTSGTGYIYLRAGTSGNGQLKTIGNLWASGATTDNLLTNALNATVTDSTSLTLQAGSVTLFAADGIDLNGTITTNGGYVRMWSDSDNASGGNLIIASDITTNGGSSYLSSGTGGVAISSDVDLGSGSFSVGYDGSYTPAGYSLFGDLIVGNDITLSSSTVLNAGAFISTSGALTLNGTYNTGADVGTVTLRANSFSFSNLGFTGSANGLALEPYSTNTNIEVGGVGSFASDAFIDALRSQFSFISLGRSDSTGTTTLSTISDTAHSSGLTNLTIQGGIIQWAEDAIYTTDATSESTLTLKSGNRIISSGSNSISGNASGGTLNVVLWGDALGQEDDGVHLVNAATYGGDLWVGGGDGSTTWNGLTVGDGAAGGGNGSNHNAVDILGNISTSGGDVWIAGKNASSNDDTTSYGDIVSYGAPRTIDAGSGDITFVFNQGNGSAFEEGPYLTTLSTLGDLSFLPADVSFSSEFSWSGSYQDNQFIGDESLTGIAISSPVALSGLTLGAPGNAEDISIDDSLSLGGSLSVYADNILLGANVTTTGTQDYFGDVWLAEHIALLSKGLSSISGEYSGTLISDVTFTDGGLVNLTLYGGDGDYGGIDAGASPGAGVLGDTYSLALQLIGDTTIQMAVGTDGAAGTGHASNSGGGAGGSNLFTAFVGGDGGDAGGAGSSGGGGGGGAATVVKIGDDYIVAGGGGGGGGAGNTNPSNGTNGSEAVGGSDSSSGGVGTDRGSSTDGGGGGGGGGGISGGLGGGLVNNGSYDSGGIGGNTGTSGVIDIDGSLIYADATTGSKSDGQNKIIYSRAAVESGINFWGSIDGEFDLSIDVQSGGSVGFQGEIGAASPLQNLSVITSGVGKIVLDGAEASTVSSRQDFVGSLDVTSSLNLSANTISANDVLVRSGVFVIDVSSESQIDGDVAGDGNLTKAGTGTLTLSGANTYTGDTSISAGTLKVTGFLANGTDVIVGSGATYDVDVTDTIQSLSGEGAIDLASGVTLTTGDDGDDEISGVISGDGNLTKAGTGTLTLAGVNTYTGDTLITGGVLKVTGTLADSTDVDVAAGATYDVDATDTIQSLSGEGAIDLASGVTLTTGDDGDDEISGVISGDGNLTKAGTGTLTLSGANTYTGDTSISAGTLKVTGFLANGTDVIVGSGATYDVDVTDTIQSLSGEGAIDLASGVTLTTGDDGDDEISGVISGDGNLTKAGTGTLTLLGANTYTGDTTITDGTLVFENDAPTTASRLFSGPGSLIIQSSSDSFSESFSTAEWHLSNSERLGDLTIGKSSNRSSILIGEQIVVDDAMNIYGGDVTLGSGVGTGITVGGKIFVSTDDGDLVVDGDVVSDDASVEAVLLVAGVSGQGNVIVNGAPTIRSGEGGRVTFYTNGVAESVSLTNYLGTPSNYRYNFAYRDTIEPALGDRGRYVVFSEAYSLGGPSSVQIPIISPQPSPTSEPTSTPQVVTEPAPSPEPSTEPAPEPAQSVELAPATTPSSQPVPPGAPPPEPAKSVKPAPATTPSSQTVPPAASLPSQTPAPAQISEPTPVPTPVEVVSKGLSGGGDPSSALDGLIPGADSNNAAQAQAAEQAFGHNLADALAQGLSLEDAMAGAVSINSTMQETQNRLSEPKSAADTVVSSLAGDGASSLEPSVDTTAMPAADAAAVLSAYDAALSQALEGGASPGEALAAANAAAASVAGSIQNSSGPTTPVDIAGSALSGGAAAASALKPSVDTSAMSPEAAAAVGGAYDEALASALAGGATLEQAMASADAAAGRKAALAAAEAQRLQDPAMALSAGQGIDNLIEQMIPGGADASADMVKSFEDAMAAAIASGMSMEEALKGAVMVAELRLATEQNLQLPKDDLDVALSVMSGDSADAAWLDNPKVQEALLEAIAAGEPMDTALAKILEQLDLYERLEITIPDTLQRLFASGGDLSNLLESAVDKSELTAFEWRVVVKVFEDELLAGLSRSENLEEALNAGLTAAEKMKVAALAARLEKNEQDRAVLDAARGEVVPVAQLRSLVEEFGLQ